MAAASSFAASRVEMKVVETIIHLCPEQPRRLRHMAPDHLWRLVAPYGLMPEEGKRR